MPRQRVEPVTTRVKITPELAAKWLERNTINRRLDEKWVAQLRDVILRGEWQFNGDAIRRTVDGDLLDGQHRLWAICLAEKAVDSLVVDNLPRDTQQTIDRGKRRSFADELRMQGFTSPNQLAAVINVTWKLENDHIRTSRVPTISQGLRILKEHPDLVDAVGMGYRFSRKIPGSSPAVIGALYYQFSLRDADAAADFIERLIEGLELTRDHPIFALRRHITVSKTSPVMLAALTIKTWNYYLEGRSVSAIAWRPVGKAPEPFPEISGEL